MEKHRLCTDVVIGMLELSCESFVELDKFLNDYDKFLKTIGIEKVGLDFGFRFAEYVRLQLGGFSSKVQTFKKKAEMKLALGKMYDVYVNFINDNKEILSEFSNNVEGRLLIDFCLDFKLESYLEIYNYLLFNYEKKNEYLEKLRTLKKIKFNKFTYIPDGDFDKVEIMEIDVPKSDGWICSDVSVKGIVTDGNMEGLIQDYDSSRYPVKISGANYIIRYFQNYLDELYDENFIELKNLDFDIATLPTYEDLYKKITLPKIDFEGVKAKNNAVDSILSINNYRSFVLGLIQSINNYLNQLEVAKDCQTRDEIIVKINNFKLVLDDLEKLGLVVKNEYIKDGILTEGEVNSAVVSGNRRKILEHVISTN